ncbi:Ribosome biogenesis protein brx1 [Metarhizium acridum]|uniref:Ribosome biogenesis protein brx1 n=1 Tax=Metarhizium acridum TaxID=92637 RepID=UPI001C6B4B79|nr:Ribosome biogenesis protein brx1 [Metarhizium acridum]KAG8419288.1 Ribosome biogenesis protein brx1 [Metarhizium acridum]
MGFGFADGKIWVRNYQISEEEASVVLSGDDDKGKKPKGGATSRAGNTEIKLIEIGPRFVRTPIIIQEGSFGGPIIYENRESNSPNQLRSDIRKAKASRHDARVEQNMDRLSRKGELGLRSSSGQRRAKDELSNKLFLHRGSIRREGGGGGWSRQRSCQIWRRS